MYVNAFSFQCDTQSSQKLFNKVVECLVFWERMFIENRYACVKVNNFIDDRFAGF